jgi:hypothetical protein
MSKQRYSQEKGNRFENRTIKRLWTAVGRVWPWKQHEKPDEGFHPPPELADWRFEFRARKAPGVYSALKKARAEADYPDRIACVFSESGTDRAFDTDRVFVAVPWSLFAEMLELFLRRRVPAMPRETRAARLPSVFELTDPEPSSILRPPGPGDDNA